MKVVHAGGLTCAILMVAGSSFGQMFYPPSQDADDILQRFARSQGLQVESGKGTAIEQIVDAYAAKNNIQLKERSTEDSKERFHIITESEFQRLLSKADNGAKLANLEFKIIKYIAFVGVGLAGTMSEQELVDKISPMFDYVKAVAKRADGLTLSQYASYLKVQDALSKLAAQQAQRSQMLCQIARDNLMGQILETDRRVNVAIDRMKDITYETNISVSSRYRGFCTKHGEEYDTRYGSGCAWCRQADYGGGKTTNVRCGVHGYWFDPAIGCPGCKTSAR